MIPSASLPDAPSRARGYVALVLHAHLPFVRHPEYEEFLEERWLYEAITESYLPLLDVLSGLVADRVPHRVTLSLSPPLLNMLSDPLLQGRYLRHLEKLIAFSESEVGRTRGDAQLHRVAVHYRDLLRRTRRSYVETYEGDLVHGFRRLQEQGGLQIIACPATHGFLPLLAEQEESVRAQIRIGLAEYQRFFGREPQAMWLPEAGYYDGLDRILAQHGVRCVVLEGHGLLHARPRPVFAVWAPIVSRAGVVAFGRDGESSAQVWSATHGYPGDFDYRDFYRDAGFDLDHGLVSALLPPTGERVAIGVKYHRITGHTDAKEPYVVEWARAKVEAHAINFLRSRERQIGWLASTMQHPPIVVAPYDAELFGHWWFEGPQWLDVMIRKAAYDQHTFALATPMDYLARHPVAQEAEPAASSWGEGGYNGVWLSGDNDWIYRHLHAAARRMAKLARRFHDATGLELRALNQAARELLLAQASDWGFIMSRGTVVNYAVQRTRTHLARFNRLADALLEGRLELDWLSEIEARDPIFPAIDYRAFR
ncbi:MAG: 1,4-alpha-glucan branching protein domain-containing protein [Thermodesulfobacteriota bacterium]